MSRVLRSITNKLTLPFTSAICASAAVIYCQRANERVSRLSLRQTMVLADARWLDPNLYWRILGPKGWQRNGSRFLLIGVLLNIIAGIIGPLQEALVDSTSIKTPTFPKHGPPLFDLPDLFENSQTDVLLTTVMGRSAMQGAQADEPQAKFW